MPVKSTGQSMTRLHQNHSMRYRRNDIIKPDDPNLMQVKNHRAVM